MDLSRPSTGRQRKRNFITVLGTKNAGKNDISEYLFFHSYPYNLLIIHHLHLCFCIKDSKRKKESRSDCVKEEKRRGWKWIISVV